MTPNTNYDDDLTLSADKQLEPAPEGLHPAICIDVINCGKELEEFTDKDTGNVTRREVKKVIFVWQIFPESGARDTGGAPFLADTKLTFSLAEISKLYLMLCSWRGEPYTANELQKFNLGKLIGQSCELEIFWKPSMTGGAYGNIKDAVTRDRQNKERKFPAITPYNGPALTPEHDKYDREWIIKKHERMNAAKARNAAASASPAPSQPPTGDIGYDDTVPF